MARVVLATFGSLGDLHPAIALALELRRRGHRAEIATSEFYRGKISALGLPFHAVPPDGAPSDEAVVRRLMDGHRGPERLLRELIFPVVPAMHAQLQAAVAGADLLVASELVYAAPIIAEQTGLPWVSYALAPISFFSRCDPCRLPLPRGLGWIGSLGPGVNRVVLALARQISHRWSAPLRAYRRELGLPAGGNALFEGKFSPHLNLALFSPVLQAPQPDWPANTVQCGSPFFDEQETTPSLPAPVEQFLTAGAPPVVFTLGSSAVHIADNFYAASAKAAQALGQRALLLVGKNPPPSNLPASMLAWDYLPFAQVFARAAVVVHQGGVGTTSQALRAGRPMLVLPFSFDQFDNAARVVRLGTARTIARSHYTAPRVAREIAALLRQPSYARRAAEMVQQVGAERGVANACDALERVIRHKRR
jgi:rhamnosyltransferase subunit B